MLKITKLNLGHHNNNKININMPRLNGGWQTAEIRGITDEGTEDLEMTM